MMMTKRSRPSKILGGFCFLCLLTALGAFSVLADETIESPSIPPSGPLDLSVQLNENKLAEYWKFNLGGDYQIVGQYASNSLTEEYGAVGGVGRLLFSFIAAEETGSKYPGGLFVRVETRNKLGTELAPEDLGTSSLGYLGLIAADWSDIGLGLPDLYWKQQFLWNNLVEIRAGRMAAVSFFNVTPFSDNLTAFMNLGSIFSPTIPYPSGGSLGAVGYVGVTDHLYLLGTAIDANGEWDGNGDPGAGELFKGIEFGWNGQGNEKGKPYLLDNVHVVYWHRDAIDETQTPSGQGVSFAFSRWFAERNMGGFIRAGWSDASEASLLEKSASAGLTAHVTERDDYTGIALSWGRTFDSDVDQVTAEVFYRFQLTKHIAITPNIQLLVNPVLNPDQSSVWVGGLRLRFAP